jgi:hypothetical protein
LAKEGFLKRWLKTTLKVVGAAVGLGAVGMTAFVTLQVRAYDASMEKVYDVPPLDVTRSSDPAVLARGMHLAESVAPCSAQPCHGPDYGGGDRIEMGPVATLVGPNVTRSMPSYTDGELARLLRHGIKRDGRSVVFMPVQDFGWLPDDDLAALVSYLRTVAPSDRSPAPSAIKTLGKVLDRKDKLVFDVARRIDHTAGARPKGATPTVEYGRFLAMGCQGCHGEGFSGGPLPGAPSTMAIPLNLTPHETGIKDYTFDDFNKLLNEGIRRNGKHLDPLMPFQAYAKFDDIERRALWAFLRSLPPRPFGGR